MNKCCSWVLGAVIIASSTFSGCSSAPAAPPQNSGLPDTLIVGIDSSFPPMGFLDETNQLVGVDLDLAAAVCDKLGIALEVRPISWDTKTLELSMGKINCIWNGLTTTEDRRQEFTMSQPYMSNAQVIVVDMNSPIDTIDALAGKRVGVQSGSSALTALHAHPIYDKLSADSIVEYNDNITGMGDLNLGRVDALVIDRVVADYYIPKSKLPFRILTDSVATEQFAIAFRKGDETLRDAVVQALLELSAEGVLDDISHKWFGPNSFFLL